MKKAEDRIHVHPTKHFDVIVIYFGQGIFITGTMVSENSGENQEMLWMTKYGNSVFPRSRKYQKEVTKENIPVS